MERQRSLVYRYYSILSRFNKSAKKELEEKFSLITKNSIEIAEVTVAGFYKIRPELLRLKTNKREIVKPKAMLYFLLYIYLDIKSSDIEKEYRVSRATIIHHCEGFIDEYFAYKSFQQKIDNLLSRDGMQECIRKFSTKKRK